MNIMANAILKDHKPKWYSIAGLYDQVQILKHYCHWQKF